MTQDGLKLAMRPHCGRKSCDDRQGGEAHMRTAFAVVLLFAVAAQAALYRGSVTRKAEDLYKIDGTSILIKTRYCYEFAFAEDVVIDTTRNELIFTDSGSKCDIEAIIK
jgi:hypothetical protein